MKTGDQVEKHIEKITVKPNPGMFLWLITGTIWASLVLFSTHPGSITQYVQMFAMAAAYLNVLVLFMGYKKSYRTAYYKVADGYENMYSNKAAINAFTAKYKSPLSRWSMNLFGREPERILIGKYALKEPITGKLAKTVSKYDLSSEDAVALEPGKEDFSADHPYVMSNYLAMTPKGLQIEQELEANPLMLWDSALKDVSEQYDLDSYFAAKRKKELAADVSQRAIDSMMRKPLSDNQKMVLSAFDGLYNKKEEDAKYRAEKLRAENDMLHEKNFYLEQTIKEKRYYND